MSKPEWDGKPFEVLPEREILVGVRCRDATCGGCQKWSCYPFVAGQETRYYCTLFGTPLEQSDVWSDQQGTYTGDLSKEFVRLEKCKEKEKK